MADNGLVYSLNISENIIAGNGGNGSGSESSWSNKTAELLKEDIEQSHHFVISIDKLMTYLPSSYKAPLDKGEKFLPVRSISFTRASFENMSIPLGVLGSLPILHRKNLGSLTLSIYDNDREPVERAIKDWTALCFPQDKYVNYLSNIVGTMKYTSYGVTGKRNDAVSGTYYVIPANNVTVNRAYDENGAKFIDFSVVIIG